MKKLKINITIFILLVVILTSCEKGLDPVFYGSLNPTIFPSNEEEFESYAMYAYVPFMLKWGYQENNNWYYTFFGPEEGMVQMFDAPTDLMTVFSSWGDGSVFWESKSKGNFAPLVAQSRNRSHFEKVRYITRVTKIIYDLEKSNVFKNEDFRKLLIAEAKCARGWAMFYLLQLFGPVPVITDPAKVGDINAESDLRRPSRVEYVNQIISDLTYAAEILPRNAKDYGRFNKGLALTLLMRLYMNEKDFINAEKIGREIQKLGYQLVDDYASLFREVTERNSETIYAISCDPSSQGRRPDGSFNPFKWYVFPSDHNQTPGWSQVFAATWEFYDSFDPNDVRRSLLLSSYVTSSGAVKNRNNGLRGAIINKYPPEGSGSFYGNDVPIARYADIMLMLAEAINENNNGPTQEAIDLVNAVRARAKIGNLSSADIASKEAFNNAILRERAWELYFEGFRLPDLVRHGKWPSAVQGIAGKEPGPAIYPLPQYAVLDGVEQNPEYK